jgi:hypothetical protein
MSLSLTSLLLVEEDVPLAARVALRKANLAPEEERRPLLVEAANALYREAHIDCDDARELVGLE